MRECLILAGGLGTRLRSVVSDRPKCLAKINNHTFIDFLILFLSKNNVNRFIFSLGYQSEQIVSHLNENYKGKIDFVTIIEPEQLGTGGAISFAIKNCKTDNVLILNGDTFFNFDLNSLFCFHKSKNANCSITLTEMKNFDRYGSVILNDNKQVIEFEEKTYKAEGKINTGFMIMNKNYFLSRNNPYIFSLENDYLKSEIKFGNTYGLLLNGDFIDIGIPDDYEKALSFFSKLNLI